MQQLFTSNDEGAWIDLGKGVMRKVLAYNNELMLVKVKFEKGAVGELHKHPHAQTSYVSEGKFKYSIGNEEQVLTLGDSCVIPGMVLHGCECLEAGELIDSFSPIREDFI